MDEARIKEKGWWAEGLLFENCSCQSVCPGHIHFDQLCTYERCKGYWAFRFEDGEVGAVRLEGRKAVIAYDCPQHMIDGGWTQVLLVDEGASRSEREALDALFRGDLGGPWEVLGRFVETRLPTRYLPIEMKTEERTKSVTVPQLLESTIETLRGRNRDEPVRFENIFNQIHAPSQVVAMGGARYDDGTIQFHNEKSHGLWSNFSWRVTAS